MFRKIADEHLAGGGLVGKQRGRCTDLKTMVRLHPQWM